MVDGQPDHILVQYDDWRTADPSHRLPEVWAGETMLELAGTTPRATTSPPSGPTIPAQPMDADGDFWGHRGTTWTRYHKNFRHNHDNPSDDPVGGPDRNYFGDRRATFKHYQDDGPEVHVEDSWKENLRDDPKGCAWARRTFFYVLASHPQVYYHDVTEESRLPRQAPRQKGPTPEVRGLHQLTHMAYHCWCKVCLRAKARGTCHKQQYDRQPLLQADYRFRQ